MSIKVNKNLIFLNNFFYENDTFSKVSLVKSAKIIKIYYKLLKNLI